MQIANVFVKAKAELSDFKREFDAQASQAGDAAGVQAGQSFSSRFKTAVVDTGSLVATAAFAAMTKGAAEMERAQGNFQAATGRSREEAQAFADDMNGLVGRAATVGRSFEDIAGAGTEVARQFELTGAANQAMTEDFLAFSKVTSQDAVGAVEDFDAALDAFDEPAERANGLMDQLVASNLKYGTDAGPAALSALAAMAPALKGMGEGLDTGVGLLNLFESAGIEAGSTTRGLNTAIQNLRPGENLDDLIARIGAIEDPLLRVQEASKVFGSLLGPKLANAIKPGTTSLSEFVITTEESGGRLDTAAEDMVTTTDKIRMGVERLMGGLRDVGADFGPLVTGVSGLATLLGPSLIRVLQGIGKEAGTAGGAAVAEGLVDGAGAATGAVGTVVGNVIGEGVSTGIKVATPGTVLATVGSATTAGAAGGAAHATAYVEGATGRGFIARMIAGMGIAGTPLAAGATALGGIVGKAFGAGLAVAVPAALVGAGVFISDKILEMGANAVGDMTIAQSAQFRIDAEAFGNSIGASWDQVIAAINAEMTRTGETGVAGFQRAFEAIRARGTLEAATVGPTIVGGIEEGLEGAAPALSGALGTVLAEVAADPRLQVKADLIGKGIPEDIAAQWVDHEPTIQQAAAFMLSPAASEVDDAIRKATLVAAGLPDSIAEELISGKNPIFRAMGFGVSGMEPAMENAADDVVGEADRMTDDLAGTLRGSRDVVKTAMDALMWAIEHPMALTRRVAEVEGALMGTKLRDGLASTNPGIRTVAEQQRAILIAQWESLTGKAYNAGEDAGDAWSDAYRRNLDAGSPAGFGEFSRGGSRYPGHRQHGGPVERGLGYIVGERRPELFVPDSKGYILPKVPGPGRESGTMHHDGTIEVKLDPASIREMRANGASWRDIGSVASAAASAFSRGMALEFDLSG